MRKQYQWRTASEIISGGYPGEEYGVFGGTPDWQTTDVMSGNATAQYYYRDSSSALNSQSSRVVVTIQESWVASIDQKNYLTVTLNTSIQSIVRDDIRGNPGALRFNIFVRREEGGQVLWSALNDAINTAHTIMSTPITLDEYTFVLPPGQNLSRGSIYYRSNTVGHDDDPLPNIYTDVLWLGTEFRNPLPKDHRVGATLKADNEYGEAENIVWVNHNDKNAGCHVLSDVGNITWKEMRSSGDGSIQTEAPSILKAPNDNSWYNQRELGKYTRS